MGCCRIKMANLCECEWREGSRVCGVLHDFVGFSRLCSWAIKPASVASHSWFKRIPGEDDAFGPLGLEL